VELPFGAGIAAFAALTFFLAGFVKGVIGLGLPTIVVGLLGAVMAPAQAIALMIVPSLVTNVWQLATGPSLVALGRRLGSLLACLCVGILAGAVLGSVASGVWAKAGLGTALATYALLGLVALRFAVSARAEPWLSPLMGGATGLVAAATGIFVIPSVPYLQALGLARDDLVQALGLVFTVATVALAIALAGVGQFDPALAAVSLLGLIPAGAGMHLGARLRARIPPGLFRACFMVALLLLGVHLAVSALI